MKYYQVTVSLKNGFKYSYTCIERMLEGMKKSSEGYWTEKIEVVEITEEDHLKTRNISFTEDKVLRKAIVKSAKIVDQGKLLARKGKLVAPKVVPTKNPRKTKPKGNLEDFL